jgi:hypothetical protein
VLVSLVVTKPAGAALVWSGWEYLGGRLAGKPAVSAWPGRVDVFVRGTDQALYHSTLGVPGFEALGGMLGPPGTAGQPGWDPAAVSWAPGRIDVFVVGADQALWHRASLNGAWSAWESRGGQLTSSPAVSSWAPGRLDVFGRGIDGALWHQFFDNGAWSPWEPLGGALTGGPAAMSSSQGRIDAFVAGVDQTLWHRASLNGAWSPWEGLGGVLTSDPTVSSSGAGRLDVFVRGADATVYQDTFTGAWSGFAQIPGGIITSAPGAASPTSGRIDLFARGADNALYHRVGAPFTTSTTSTTSTTTTTTTTMPGMGQPDRCTFTSFCDAFQTINAGGRAGDLDESKWSAARTTQATNPRAGLVNNYAPFTPEFCTDHNAPNRVPDNDSFICGAQFGESNHWMEGMNDQDSYVNNSFRVLQPFDFAGRTSTFDFSVDARTQGSHSAWVSMWLTPDPQQAPHEDFPGTHLFPRQGVQFLFNADWCGSGEHNGLRQVNVYDGYQVSDGHDYLYSPCFTTQDDMANHFQLRVSQSRIEVWVSDKDGTHFSLRGAANVNLPFTRGYWSLQHSQYAADKFNSMNPTTYHWHAVSFDGPVLPVDRSYQVPDALTPGPNGSVNLGYQTNTPTFTLSNVNPTGARAYLTFNVYWYSSPTALNVTVNGNTTRVRDPTPDIASHLYQWHFLVVPVPLNALHPGANTIQIANTGCADNCPTVANIDLEVVR